LISTITRRTGWDWWERKISLRRLSSAVRFFTNGRHSGSHLPCWLRTRRISQSQEVDALTLPKIDTLRLLLVHLDLEQCQFLP
jgi:hypothetical protein